MHPLSSTSFKDVDLHLCEDHSASFFSKTWTARAFFFFMKNVFYLVLSPGLFLLGPLRICSKSRQPLPAVVAGF